MKRSTVLAIMAVLGLTLFIALAKVFIPSSVINSIKVVITGKEWLNTEFGRDRIELKGKNTLVVFWNASDIHSRKTVKKINEWKAQYDGLLQITGVHCPEFEFEKEKKNIVRVVEEMKIKWPVVLDNNNTLRKMFRNEELPVLYLINKDGKTIYTHKGDGDYEKSEAAIQLVVKELEPNAMMPEIKKPKITGICFITTPDLYAGPKKGSIVNIGGFVIEKTHDYKWNTDLPADSIALKGKFKAIKDYIESSGQAAQVLLNFGATEVNIVADPDTAGEASLEILFDGKPIKKEIKGRNIDDKDQVKIKYPGMYQLLKNNEKAEKGILSIKVTKGKLKLYAFRFYGCSE